MTPDSITAEIGAALDRVNDPSVGPSGLNIVLASNRDAAMRAADDVASRLAEDAALPLAGMPIVLKDNIATLDTPTTCGSRILRGYVSPYEATAVTRLRAKGAVMVAKANMDEFAMGSSNENSAFGPVANPWDRARVPGGSSGGSAASVAADTLPRAETTGPGMDKSSLKARGQSR